MWLRCDASRDSWNWLHRSDASQMSQAKMKDNQNMHWLNEHSLMNFIEQLDLSGKKSKSTLDLNGKKVFMFFFLRWCDVSQRRVAESQVFSGFFMWLSATRLAACIWRRITSLVPMLQFDFCHIFQHYHHSLYECTIQSKIFSH